MMAFRVVKMRLIPEDLPRNLQLCIPQPGNYNNLLTRKPLSWQATSAVQLRFNYSIFTIVFHSNKKALISFVMLP